MSKLSTQTDTVDIIYEHDGNFNIEIIRTTENQQIEFLSHKMNL